jgi:hypothetical protein
MRDLIFVVVAIGMSVLTAVVAHLNDIGVPSIVQLVLIENVFLLSLQIFFYVRGEDPYLGEAARSVRRFKDAIPLFKAILQNAVNGLSSTNQVIQGKSLEFLSEVNVSLASLGSGIVDVDLRPGGSFFRELHAGGHAKKTYCATTCADPEIYWGSTSGRNLLLRSRHAVDSGVSIKRIFLHSANSLADLRSAIDANKAAGVDVFFVDADAIEPRLVRDFGICDEGELAVELFLDAKRHPERVRFFLSGVPSADKEINDLKKTWDELIALAVPVN